MTFVARDDRINISWAGWFFRSEPGLELIRKASPGSAGRNRTLAIDRFENLEIPLPPIEEQRRVAGGLDRLERGVRSLDALGQRSTLLAAATRSALVRGNDELLSWRPVSLNDVLSLRCDETRVEPDATFQMAGVYSFGRGLFARADLEGGRTSYKVLHKLVEGHLVMSRLKAWEGALALVPARFGGFFLSPEFPTFEINTDLADPHFLGALLTSEPFWSRLRGASKGIGARKERVNANRLLEQEILLPPLAEQRARSAPIDRLTAVQEGSTRRAVRAGALVPSVMNQVFASLS
jgi:type I restriction enzyme S subunit